MFLLTTLILVIKILLVKLSYYYANIKIVFSLLIISCLGTSVLTFDVYFVL